MAVVVPSYLVNRAVLLPMADGNMLAVAPGESIASDIADFSSSLIGSFQVYWIGANTVDSMFEIFVSNYTDPLTFGKYPDSKVAMDADCNSLLWNVNVLGFRYGFVRYYRSLTLTAGKMEIIALGKR